jgi:DNA-binding XRE family transcriptional regulator
MIAAFVKHSDGRTTCGDKFPCIRCSSTGEVPDEMAEWMKEGRKMRDKRVNENPYRSVQEEAKRLGIKPSTLCKMEQGRMNPTCPIKEA